MAKKNTVLLKTPGNLPDIWIISNWRDVLKRAWSIRWIIAVTLLGAAGPVLPLIDEVVYVPRWLYIPAVFLTGAAALVSRFIPQKGITDG